MEIWKDIVGYEKLYKVSNKSNIKNVKYEKYKTATLDKDGYLVITLYKGGVGKQYKVHRLVAQAFIPNPDNLPQVNHKDENKQNNYANNLEWCNCKYNANYGTVKIRRANKLKKPILQIKNNIIVNQWNSIVDASKKTSISRGNISACLCNKRKTAGGFKWEYANYNASNKKLEEY